MLKERLKDSAKLRLEVKFIHGSDQFQVLERDDVVCEGNVTVADGKVTKTYFNNELDRLEHTGDPMTIETEDLYKEFRLAGYEYGRNFMLMQKAPIQGYNGIVRWNGNWVTFLDAMTHLAIRRVDKTFTIPRNFVCLVIDPVEQRRKLEKFGSDLPVLSEPFGVRRAGGIHSYGVAARYVFHVDQKPAEHEVYRFVPNSRPLGTPQGSSRHPSGDTCPPETLLSYAKCCQNQLSKLGSKGDKSGFKDITVHAKMEDGSHLETKANTIIEHVEHSEINGFLDPSLHSLLGFIKTVNDISKDPNDAELKKEVFETVPTKLSTDILLTNLQQAQILRPCLDIVCRNVYSRNIRVVELGKTRLSDICQSILPPFVNVSRFVAAQDSNDKEQLTEESSHVDIIEWGPCNKVPEQLEKFHFVVSDNMLRKQSNRRNALTGISEALHEGGFVLVREVTSAFQLAALIDGALDTKYAQECDDADERSFGIYCDAMTWRKLFSEAGFEVISEVTDVMMMSLFLLRKRMTNTVAKQTFLELTGDQQNFHWLAELRSLVEEMGKRPKGENLWLISNNKYSGVLGMVNCLRNEPDKDRLRCIFNMDDTPLVLDTKTKETLVKQDLYMNVLKDGNWGCYCHIPLGKLPLVMTENAYVNPTKRGNLSSLTWIQSPLKYERQSVGGPTEICTVNYASLNFRDVMLATGKLSTDAIPGQLVDFDHMLGTEFSGLDTSGNRVMGMVPINGLATKVKADKRLLWSVPDNWTLEEAATVPVVYATAFYALVIRGHISSGKSVLIHSGTGGVGQAAISIALSYGCKVFTTVGTDEKRQYIKKKFPQLNDEDIFSSRDIGFELGIKAATKDRGVDIVLNSLAEDKLFASVRCLARHGTFLEIGKYDLAKNSSLGMNVFLKNISFHGILLDSLFEFEHGELEAVTRCLVDGIKTGIVRPLQSTVFDKDNVEGAFRYMANGKHIGKVLIKVRGEEEISMVPALRKTYFYPDKSYIITGGLGGFGLELAHWLVRRGARNLVLTSRSGVKTGYQRRKLFKLNEAGANVVVSNKNICNKNEVKELLGSANGQPVGGVFHLAGVLRDAILENQTKESFMAVTGPKVTGTMNLDHVTRELCKDNLDWFVAFSSTSSGYGHAGQGPYGFANSVLERIVEQRQSDGLPGLAIQWGPVGDIGMFIDNVGDNNTVVGGTIPQRIRSCLSSLDLFLQQSEPVVAVYVTADKSTATSSENKAQDLVSAVCNILGAKDASSLDLNKTLGDLGLDSLLTVELTLLLENDYGIILSSKELRETSINKLKSMEALKENSVNDTDGGVKEPAKVKLSDYIKTAEIIPKRMVTKMNSVEEGVPLFIVHDMFGFIVQSFGEVASQLNVPVYGFERTEEVPVTTIQDMAAFYVQKLMDISGGTAVHLAGYSFGAIIVQEMLLQLQARDYDVRSVFCLDGSPQFSKIFVSEEQKTWNDTSDALWGELMNGFKQVLNEEINSEYLEAEAQKLSAILPEVTTEAARSLIKGIGNSLRWCNTYQQSGQYGGKINLIKSEESARYPGTTDDFGIVQFCTGSVKVDTVPGNHNTFLKKESGKVVARIINRAVSSA